ncbi:MAG TPA: glycosyltransferase [Candidatus Krumholzibacteria bacterium]|nr:glycosyltransferase [Candidatus Krumholzibacteria bacterium]
MRLPISVCMIVRDEAEVLGVALESVRSWAEQVVVVDTGSRDDSLDVARRHGALVEQIEWKNDFSAARNVSMDLASAPWILIVDADEWIDPADTPRLATLIAEEPVRAYRFPQRNYVSNSGWARFVAGPMPPVWGLEAVGWVEARQVRLVPNRPGIRYEGPVHETMSGALERAGVERSDAEVPIHHVGKLRSEAVMARKKQLYHHLGRLKLQTHPGGQALLELGIQCSELGETAEARELLTRSLDELGPGPERARAVACLASQIETLDGLGAAESFLRTELPGVAGFPDAWERLGVLLVRAQRFARAAEVLESAVEAFPDAANLVVLAAECELTLGQYDRAAGLYDRLRTVAAGAGIGEVGFGIARAAQGDVGPLIECLRDPATSAFARGPRGAQRRLRADWILGGGPGTLRSAGTDVVRVELQSAYAARGRLAAAHALDPGLVTAARCGLEAVVRSLPRGAAARSVASRAAAMAGATRWSAADAALSTAH